MVPPSEIQLLIKTHRTTIVIQTPFSATIQSVKSSVLSALTQFGNSGTLEDVPSINSEEDFELCEMVGSRYVTLDASKTVRDKKLATWVTLFIRFRDESGTLQDVEVTEPSPDDDEDPQFQSQTGEGVTGKGKA